MDRVTSAFGVDHGYELSKGFGPFLRGAKKAKAVDQIKLNFKPIKPGVKPTGPGSRRGEMDHSAHETRLAAKRRNE